MEMFQRTANALTEKESVVVVVRGGRGNLPRTDNLFSVFISWCQDHGVCNCWSRALLLIGLLKRFEID